MIRIFGPKEIQPHLDIESLIPSAEAAFRAISSGTAQSPVSVLHPSDQSDIHVKSATLPQCPILVVKVAGASQVLAQKGEPSSSGMIAVFDSLTCKLLAILKDDHLISDYRTAAAGAHVAKLFVPNNAKSALVVGTGTQARLQARALLSVRPLKQLCVWGRSTTNLRTLHSVLQSAFPNVEVVPVEDLADAVPKVDVIITATGARDPLIQADWVREGQHITTVGSDDTMKCEIDPSILRFSDVFVDAKSSATKYGVPSRAIAEELITADDLTEIGVADSLHADRSSRITVACLSGLGVQDLTAVDAIWHKMSN